MSEEKRFSINPKHLVLVLGLIAAGLWFFGGASRPSEAQILAKTFDEMSRSGAHPDELCNRAKDVELAFAKEGDADRTKQWTEMRNINCLNADVCRSMAGGCRY